MLPQTRINDINLFTELSGKENISSMKDVPFSLLVSSFVTNELKTTFQIDFLIFIPFLIIDLVVASVVMASVLISMGMMMLSPLIIFFPFKLMLFVTIDGWTLIIDTLASIFYI